MTSYSKKRTRDMDGRIRAYVLWAAVVLWLIETALAVRWCLVPDDVRFEPLIAVIGLGAVAVSGVRMAGVDVQRMFRRRRRTAVPIIADHLRFIRALNRSGVQYLVVGGMAALVYGEVRTTGDLDVWVGSMPDNNERLNRALAELGLRRPSESPDIFRLGDRPVDIYVDVRMGTREFSECYARRSSVTVNGVQIKLLSPVDRFLDRHAA